MHPNADLLTRFYTALAAKDPVVMGDCYAQDASFSDPVFTDLHGPEVAKMWRMLCSRAKDLEVTFDGIEADDSQGRARWVATYSFSGTGHRVVNRIESGFVFKDGRIQQQTDSFDLYRWARQALGIKGLLLGWLPPVQAGIRKQAKGRLTAYKG